MDLSKIWELVMSNPLLLILGLFLFKDELKSLLGFIKLPTPVKPDPVVPTPVVVVPPPSPVGPDHPIVDTLVSILPTLLPILIGLLKQKAEQESKALDVVS